METKGTEEGMASHISERAAGTHFPVEPTMHAWAGDHRDSTEGGQASIPGKHVHLRGTPAPLLISQNASDSTCKAATQALK